MAGSTDALKETSSYTTLLRAMDDASTPLPIKILRMSHMGRVIEDGIANGTQGLLASIAGLPVDLYGFAKERITGFKSATPEDQKVMSSAWLEKKMEHQYTEQTKMLGRERPVLREGTADGLIHIGAQFVPTVGSLFLPGVGEARLAAMGSKFGKAGEIAGKLAGKLGFQLNAADLTTIGVKYGEKLAGIERPVESTGTKLAAAPLQSLSKSFTSAGDTKENFAKVSHSLSNTPPLNPKEISIIGQVMGGHLKDRSKPETFNPIQVKALQTALVEAGHLKPSQKNPEPVDGIIGTETVNALDIVIKKTIQPASVTGDVRKAHIQRMTEIAQDLKTNPASRLNFDPRVVELQTSAYALGLYNKKIDGLAGDETLKSMAQLEAPKRSITAQSREFRSDPTPS